MASVFISYRRNDSPGHAGRLFDAMRSSFGTDDVFMDITGIAKGEDFPSAIEQAIAQAKIMLLVIGPEWNQGERLSAEHDWVRQEIVLGLKQRIPVLPVLVNGAIFPKDVPKPLRRLLTIEDIELRDARWESDVQQVVDAVKISLSPELARQKRTHRKPFRILLIHDVATSDGDRTWQQQCRVTLLASLNRWSKIPLPVDVRFFSCADMLDSSHATGEQLQDTVSALLASATQPGASGERLSPETALPDRWTHTAGAMGVWLLDEKARRRVSNELLEEVKTFKPMLVLAYSVGALVTYELFAREPRASRNLPLVTLAPPLGPHRIRATFGGRIGELPSARFWLNLFNHIDAPFAQPLRIKQPNFAEFEVSFPMCAADSDAVEEYLNHLRTRQDFWRFVTTPQRATVSQLFFKRRADRRRALLVGINRYPDRDNNLLGCINDVYLMSAVLQESGFESESIAAVMNERATSDRVRERLHWLLDDAGEGDQRIFYFSGHGAIIPYIDPAELTGMPLEALATYDFEWSLQSSISDSFLAEVCSQLPYSTSLIMILDCGFPQIGGQVSSRGTRGLNSPEDVQHSLLRWDAREQIWCALESPMRGRGQSSLGWEVPLLPVNARDPTSRAKYDSLQRTYRHQGPYLPVVMNGCGQHELCLEFRHGTMWYGAFTYALCINLRRAQMDGKSKGITSVRLIEKARETLATLRVPQTPRVAGPLLRWPQLRSVRPSRDQY